MAHAARLLALSLCAFLLSSAPVHAEEPPTAASIDGILSPLANDRLFRANGVGVHVVNLRTGEEVFGRNQDLPLIPASTTKVLTAATALRVLGPSYQFTTGLYGDRRPEGGRLSGNLYVEGGGDPTLVVERLWKLIYDLRVEGVREIQGDVVYDASFFGTDYPIPGWDKPEDLERGPSYFPPISALALNFNTVAILVAPGDEEGEEARVKLETPASDYVVIDNQVTTSRPGTRRFIRIEREEEDDRLHFTVRGQTPTNARTGRYYRSVIDPTAHFAAAFREMLDEHGIRVRGRHRRGTTPPDAKKLVELHSPRLSVILMDLNKSSNNFAAEQVLRAMGAEAHGAPGTTEKGLALVSEYLGSLGIPARAYELDNGSGLSREARLQPRHLTRVLIDMAEDRRVGHEFRASLAIGGLDGTLWRRLRDEPGRLRGKTGTLDGVHSLTGYIDSSDGDIYAFAFLVNNPRGRIVHVRRLHDRFAQRLFGLSPLPTELVDGSEEAD